MVHCGTDYFINTMYDNIICLLNKHYCIAQTFDGGNFGVFDAFQPHYQNLTHKNFKALQHLQEKTVTIHQNIFCQIFE